MSLSLPERTTGLLMRIVTEGDEPRMTIYQLVGALGDRAFGLALLLFALPNCVPSPPGIGSLLGFPPLLFSLQLMLGQHKPWVPHWLGRRDFAKIDLRRIITRAAPGLRAFESLCRPRLQVLTQGIFLRLLGFFIFLLAVLIVIPLPGTNWLPGLTIACIALGLVERDGLIVLLGSVASCVVLYVTSTVAYVSFLWILKKVDAYFL